MSNSHKKFTAAKAAANSTPLPGALAAAFSVNSTRVAGIPLVALTLGHFAILQQIESPLLESKTAPSLEQIIEALYVFSRGPLESRNMLIKGRNCFTEAAYADVGIHVGIGALGDLQIALVQHLNAAFSTALGSKSEKDEATAPFPTNPQEAPPTA